MVEKLSVENKSLYDKCTEHQVDSAKYAAMCTEKDILIAEQKDIAKTWYTLAETLRVDTFAMFKSWR